MKDGVHNTVQKQKRKKPKTTCKTETETAVFLQNQTEN